MRPAPAPAAATNRGATMTTTAMQYAATLGLLGALVAATLLGLPAQVHAGTRGVGIMAQYCAPQHDSVDLHRIYCRDRGRARRAPALFAPAFGALRALTLR